MLHFRMECHMLEIKSVRPTAGMYTALWTFNGVMWSGTVYECPNCGQQMMYSQSADEKLEVWNPINMPHDYPRAEFVGFILSEQVCPYVKCCNCGIKYQEWIDSVTNSDDLKAPNPAPF